MTAPRAASAPATPDGPLHGEMVVRAARPAYVPDSQVSPAKKKRGGKRARIRKLSAKKHRTSLEFFNSLPLDKLIEWCAEHGLIPPNPVGTTCRECKTGKMLVKSINEGGCHRENAWFLCSRTTCCGHRVSVLDWLTSDEMWNEELWLPRISFRLQLKAFWLFSHRCTLEQVSELTGMDYSSSVRTLHGAYLNVVAPAQERANSELRVGGDRQHCEADEVAFRCRAADQPGDEGKIEWLRYIGVLRRGSSQIFLQQLPPRITGGAGQGGGGALSLAELDAVFKVESDDPLLVRGSLLHTDSAKAYRHIGPLHWPAPSPLKDRASFDERYKRFGYTHATVCHKRKKNQKVAYAKEVTMKLPDGTLISALAGTQTIDGFWQSLRLNTSRRGVKTGSVGSAARIRLHKLVREYQWHYWYLEQERFPLFCKLVKEQRDTRASF